MWFDTLNQTKILSRSKLGQYFICKSSRTKCSIDDIPAGFVAIMLNLLTYVCVSPSFCWPIMIVPPVPRYAVPVVCPTPETPCGWNCNIGFPFAVVDTILRLPDSCIFSAFSHPGPVGVNNVEKGNFVLNPAYACFCKSTVVVDAKPQIDYERRTLQRVVLVDISDLHLALMN